MHFTLFSPELAIKLNVTKYFPGNSQFYECISIFLAFFLGICS
jgi:hypothetical protein